MQNWIGVVLIAGGVLVWWTQQDTQSALGLLAAATGVGHMAVARVRRSRVDADAEATKSFPAESLSL